MSGKPLFRLSPKKLRGYHRISQMRGNSEMNKKAPREWRGMVLAVKNLLCIAIYNLEKKLEIRLPIEISHK